MRILVLDLGGVFYLRRPTPAMWTDWAARTGGTGRTLKPAIRHKRSS